MMKKNNMGKFFLGALVGAGLGVLFTPKTGEDTRKLLNKKAEELIEKAKEIDPKEVKDGVESRINAIKEELADLDKEKAKKIARAKAKDIQDKASELVEYAIEKGTPALEKAADSLRQKAIVVTKDILNKLEQEEK